VTASPSTAGRPETRTESVEDLVATATSLARWLVALSCSDNPSFIRIGVTTDEALRAR